MIGKNETWIMKLMLG